MKKLSLKKLKLEADSKLHRDELKTVFGGYGPLRCMVTGMPVGCPCGAPSDCASGVCEGLVHNPYTPGVCTAP